MSSRLSEIVTPLWFYLQWHFVISVTLPVVGCSPPTTFWFFQKHFFGVLVSKVSRRQELLWVMTFPLRIISTVTHASVITVIVISAWHSNSYWGRTTKSQTLTTRTTRYTEYKTILPSRFFNPSAWGHLNPSSYCDVGRLFYGVFKLWSKLQRKKMKK